MGLHVTRRLGTLEREGDAVWRAGATEGKLGLQGLWGESMCWMRKGSDS
jgi:hypothetical protein